MLKATQVLIVGTSSNRDLSLCTLLVHGETLAAGDECTRLSRSVLLDVRLDVELFEDPLVLPQNVGPMNGIVDGANLLPIHQLETCLELPADNWVVLVTCGHNGEPCTVTTN